MTHTLHFGIISMYGDSPSLKAGFRVQSNEWINAADKREMIECKIPLLVNDTPNSTISSVVVDSGTWEEWCEPWTNPTMSLHLMVEVTNPTVRLVEELRFALDFKIGRGRLADVTICTDSKDYSEVTAWYVAYASFPQHIIEIKPPIRRNT